MKRIYYTFFAIACWLPLKGTAHEILSRISVAPDVTNSNGHSFAPTISADGQFIAFHSNASNLVPNDNNGYTDIFVYDRETQQIERVNVSSRGVEANFVSFFPSISSDGRYVAFHSDASNLAGNDTNKTTDIFVYDRTTKQIEIVSVNDEGEQGNFTASAPVISGDGRYVAFHSDASNLVKNDNNELIDVFVRDRKLGKTSLVSVNSAGVQGKGVSFGAAISADGRYVAFSSDATNLDNNHKNQFTDVFVRDLHLLTTQQVSISSQGELGNSASFSPSLSEDGRYIAFVSRSSNLVNDDTNKVADIFVHDQQTHETVRISVDSQGQQANGASFAPHISPEGRYIAFNSDASNLVANDNNGLTDVFLHDRKTGETICLSLMSHGDKKTQMSFYPPALSREGHWIAFESNAWSLVSDDFNEVSDIFLYNHDYISSFTTVGERLYIPAFQIPELGMFRATLYLEHFSEALQFRLERASPIDLPLAEVAATYDVQTGLLTLPLVELIDPPRLLQQFHVKLQAILNTEPLLFNVVALEPAN